MELNKFENREQMSSAAAAFTRDLINRKTALDEVFSIALSGGNSPVRFYELLAEEDINWTKVNIFLVDERKVDADHKHSNFRMIKKALLLKIDIPETNIFSFKTKISSVSECALEYEERTVKFFGDRTPVFDLIVLGVGPDGHMASLFPGIDHSLDQESLFVSTAAPSCFDVHERLTMTLSLINSASDRIFVISGAGKEDMVHRIIIGDSNIPAGLVNPNSTIFFNNPL